MALHHDEIIQKLSEELGPDLISSSVRERQDGHLIKKIQRNLYLKVQKDALHETVVLLRGMSQLHVSCPMATKEHPWGLELIYCFTMFQGEGGFKELPVIISLDLPEEDLKVRSCTDVVPGILIMEREAREMLGIKISGIPDKRRFFTHDKIEKGYFPLRKKMEPEKGEADRDE